MPGVKTNHTSPKIDGFPRHISEVTEVLQKDDGLSVWSRLPRGYEFFDLRPEIAFPTKE
jgi:hypothetical protein